MKSNSQPLRHFLAADAEEEELRTIWRGVVARRGSSQKRRETFVLATGLTIAVLTFVVLLVAAFQIWPRPAALRDLSGRSLNVIGGGRPAAVSLSDGSRIELAANSELHVLNNDAALFSTVLRRGRGVFEVQPGGTRRWQVETTGVRVEVTGTRFVVERRDIHTLVEVERGTVVVRGERVPFGAQKLNAGERLLVDDDARAANPTAGRVGAPGALLPDPVPNQAVAPRPDVPRPSRSADFPTLADADEARRRGDWERAVRTLNAIANGPRSGQRPIAAFTMGKLLLDEMGRPASAVAAFSKCLTLAPPAAVAEDARARLVEAYARSGQKALARSAATEYLKRYPSGRRRLDVQRWADGT